MKKIIVSFIFMLSVFICCTLCSNAAEYDKIKVGLNYGSTAKSSVTVFCPEGISYGYVDGTTHYEAGQFSPTEITFRVTAQNQVIINEVQLFDAVNSNISIAPLGEFITLDGKEYRGSVILTNIDGSAMTVINLLPLEHYLYGVVPNEVSSSWDKDALKAQAVCARGFAVSNFNKHASLGFNVCATTNCQVYSGKSGEKESTNKAVDETYGQVVVYEGKPIESLFFSSSGGHTADVKNIWGSSIPYLCGVEDPYEPEDSPRHSWSVTMTLDEITSSLKTSGVNVGSVTSLDTKTDHTGRVYELTVNGTEGNKTLYRGNAYTPFASKGVLCQKYSLMPTTSGGRVLYATSGTSDTTLAGYSVIDSKLNVSELSESFYIQSSNTKEVYTSGEVTGYTFNGGGWGHGVGMSQYGAKGMADNGFSYEEILMHYYPGTELGKIY